MICPTVDKSLSVNPVSTKIKRDRPLGAFLLPIIPFQLKEQHAEMPAFQKGNTFSVGNKGGGRPSTYKPEYVKQAKKLTLLGMIDKELAAFFEVSEECLNKWKKEYPDFKQALKDGKEIADAKVTQSLYRRAMGYSHKTTKFFNDKGTILAAETTERYPPDTTAAIFWLKNRQRDKWRDRPEPSEDDLPTPDSISVNIVDASVEDDDK